MAVLPNTALYADPFQTDVQLATGSPSGNIGVGDYLIYSGQKVIPTAMGTLAHVKASGAGIAVDANPVSDWYGASKTNTGLRFVRGGIFRVSAAFSGQIPLGTPVYPASTGSGVYAATGQTGVAATWQSAPPVANSANALSSGIARVVGWHDVGNGGTGEMDILLTPSRPDYY